MILAFFPAISNACVSLCILDLKRVVLELEEDTVISDRFTESGICT